MSIWPKSQLTSTLTDSGVPQVNDWFPLTFSLVRPESWLYLSISRHVWRVIRDELMLPASFNCSPTACTVKRISVLVNLNSIVLSLCKFKIGLLSCLSEPWSWKVSQIRRGPLETADWWWSGPCSSRFCYLARHRGPEGQYIRAQDIGGLRDNISEPRTMLVGQNI